MFKLMDLNQNEVKFEKTLALTNDGRLILIDDNGFTEIKREGKYIIQSLQYGSLIPY